MLTLTCPQTSWPPLFPPIPYNSHVGAAKDSSLIHTGLGLSGECWKVHTASGVPGLGLRESAGTFSFHFSLLISA